MKKFPFLLVLVILFIACDNDSVNNDIYSEENTEITEDTENNDNEDDEIILGDI